MHIAAGQIVKVDRAFLDFEADHVWNIGRLRLACFRFAPAASRVAIRAARGLACGAIRIELFDRAVAAISESELDELVRALAITIETIALIDRTVVPFDAEPFQRADDLFGVMLAGALDVRVFDAQRHRAVVAARGGAGGDRGAGGARGEGSR